MKLALPQLQEGIILVFQILATWVLLLTVWILVIVLGDDVGTGGFVDHIQAPSFIHDIVGSLMPWVTITACLLVGLPIRLNTKIKYWWTTNSLIPILGTTTGLTLIAVSILPVITTHQKTPNETLTIAGWFVTAFFTLHIYPPKRLTMLLSNMLSGK